MEGQGGEDTQNHSHYQGSLQMTDCRRQVVSIDTQRPGSCGVQSRSNSSCARIGVDANANSLICRL
jgi:hypothetical protein